MELYGPRAAQYQYHGRAKVTPRGKSYTSLHADSDRMEKTEQELPLEDILLGEDEQDDGAESQIVPVGDGRRGDHCSIGSGSGQSGSEVSDGTDLADDNSSQNSIKLSAGGTARVYLRHILESAASSLPSEQSSAALASVVVRQSAAEPSGQEGGEQSNEGVVARIAKSIGIFTITTNSGPPSTTSDVTTGTQTLGPISPSVNRISTHLPNTVGTPHLADEEDTAALDESTAFQKLFDHTGTAHVHHTAIYHGNGLLHASLPRTSSARTLGSNYSTNPHSSSDSLASGQSSASKKSSTSQTPTQRTRNLKQKRRIIRSTQSASSRTLDLDQIMPSHRRKRSPNLRSPRTSTNSISSGFTFQSTEINLCPIDEGAQSSDEYSDQERSVETDLQSTTTLKSSSKFSDITDEDAPSSMSNDHLEIGNPSEALYERRLRDDASTSTPNDSLSLLCNGIRIPKHIKIDPHDLPRHIQFQAQEDKWFIHTDDFIDRNYRDSQSDQSRSSWTLLWTRYISQAGDSFRITTDAHLHSSYRSADSISPHQGYDEVLMQPKNFTSLYRNDYIRKNNLPKKRNHSQTPNTNLQKRRMVCFFIFPCLIIIVFFAVSTTLNKAELGRDSVHLPYQDVSNVPLQQVEIQVSKKNQTADKRYGDKDIENHTTILEAVMTALSPSTGFNIFNAEQGSPQYKALHWVINDDPMRLGTAISHASQSTSSHGLADLRLHLVQRFVLATLYYSSEFENWTNSSKWLSKNHECEWYGISCDKQFLHDTEALSEPPFNDSLGRRNERPQNSVVTQINLQQNNITINKEIGIPFELGSLTQLQELDLSKNRIEGSLGPWIGELLLLEILKLNSNRLSGQIPDEMADLHLLRKFAFCFLSCYLASLSPLGSMLARHRRN